MILQRVPVLLVLCALGAATLFQGCATSSGRPERRRARAPAAVNLAEMILPPGRVGRRVEFPLQATHITIHSTGNRGATALQHGRGMLNGAFRGRSKWNRTGYVTWHFTVDDQRTIQHLPLNIQGEHADHDGAGNRTSIAIEICEFRDSARQAAAVERAARLAGWLRRQDGIPLNRVVPHHHWPQHRFGGHQKNCPRILLESGRPGRRWMDFLQKVSRH